MEFKGTKGPWNGKEVVICKQFEAGLDLGFITSTRPGRMETGAANARLIVTAPEMLEILQMLLESQVLPQWHAELVEGVVRKALGVNNG